MTAWRVLLMGVSVLVLSATAAAAQWLNYPTPGIPRMPNGLPNLSAPVPRLADGKPDLSGIWRAICRPDPPSVCSSGPPRFFDLARGLTPGDVQLTPWAAAIQKQRFSRNHVDDPYGYCLPPGVPRITVSLPFKVLVTPGVTALLHETTVGMMFRQVFTDGRPLPSTTEPTWLGYSVGRWEGDEFVVETIGFRDRGWLDTGIARPHSDALRVIERFRRLDVGRMDLAVTIDDPKAFLKPWTVTESLVLMPDTELIESFCDAHDKTMEHRRIDPAPPEPPSPPVVER